LSGEIVCEEHEGTVMRIEAGREALRNWVIAEGERSGKEARVVRSERSPKVKRGE